MTEHTRCTFTVKEYHDATPWICVEEYEPGLSILKDGSMGISLKPGTSYDEAKEIARFLKEKVATISFMKLP